jgi:hypothetical protein
MPQRIIALFNLKKGVTVAEYEAWAKRVDLPTVNALESIDSFRVFKSVGLLGSEARPPYQYVEVIDVKDMDVFGQDIGDAKMQKVAAEFRALATDITFILTEELG